jgi:uncharacterized membrane protein
MYGPIQFSVIAFDRDDVSGDLIDKVHEVRSAGVIRLIDFLFVTKTQKGTLEEYQTSDLTPEERLEWGAVVGGLIGLGAGGFEGMAPGAAIGELMVSQNDFGLLAEDIKQILEEELRPGMAAMVVLFEHAWAVPLKQAIVDKGGVLLAQGLISPVDLIRVGAELEYAVEAEKEIEEEYKLQENAKKVKSSKSESHKGTSKKST